MIRLFGVALALLALAGCTSMGSGQPKPGPAATNLTSNFACDPGATSTTTCRELGTGKGE